MSAWLQSSISSADIMQTLLYSGNTDVGNIQIYKSIFLAIVGPHFNVREIMWKGNDSTG